MTLLFIIRFVKSNTVGAPSHIFVMAICRRNSPQLFTVWIYRGVLPQLFAVRICCGFVLCMWAKPFFCVSKSFFFVNKSFLIENKPFFVCQQNFFIYKSFFINSVSFCYSLAVMGHRIDFVNLPL